MKAVAMSDADFTEDIVSPEETQTDDSVLATRNYQKEKDSIAPIKDIINVDHEKRKQNKSKGYGFCQVNIKMCNLSLYNYLDIKMINM